MNKHAKFLIILATIFFSVDGSFAQIVNIENKRLGQKEEGWSGNIGARLNFTQNTSEIWQFGARFRVQYKKGKHKASFFSELNFVKAGDNDFVNNGYEHMRYNYQLSDSSGLVVLEAFRQTQYNRVQKIRLRALYGAGVRLNLIQKDSAEVVIGFTPMGEFEDLTTGEKNQHFRLSSYFSFNFQFTSSLGLNSITYYQPDMLNWDDYRVSHETALWFQITEKLSFSVTYNFTYDEDPPEGVPRRINVLKNGLNFRF